jgi:YjbE family integral membrane protein
MGLSSVEELLRNGWDQIGQPGVWVAVVQIIWVNIVLSGDNAVVIALACRGLPPRERMWGMIIGAGVASLLLIFFTAVVSVLMTLPYIGLASAIALVWIAVKLLAPETHDAEDTPEAVENLWRAVRVVVVADIIMSLDNVVAVAGIANGAYVLLAIGLAISIPIVIAGSAVILALLERFPILVWGGAAVLGWVAGKMFAGDPALLALLSQFDADRVKLMAQILGALLVLAAGFVWRRSYGVAMTKS